MFLGLLSFSFGLAPPPFGRYRQGWLEMSGNLAPLDDEDYARIADEAEASRLKSVNRGFLGLLGGGKGKSAAAEEKVEFIHL